MKRFLAFFVSSILLIVGIAFVAGAEQDVTGFEAYLSSKLPHTSVSLLAFLCVVGIGYSIASGLMYSKTINRRLADKKTSYLAGIAFGIPGLVIAYASYALMPSYDTFDAASSHAGLLVAGFQMVLSVAGVYLPAMSALAHALVIPMCTASFAMHDWAAKETYRKKRSHSGSKVLYAFRRLRGTV